MLYILPLAFIFSGVFFPLGVVLYWFTSNIWTMVQQFLVIRNLPTPGSEAAKAREERLARKGKAMDASGKVVPMEKYEAEQQRLYEEAQKAKAEAPKRQQPVSKQRAKKQAQKNKPTTSPERIDKRIMSTTSESDAAERPPRRRATRAGRRHRGRLPGGICSTSPTSMVTSHSMCAPAVPTSRSRTMTPTRCGCSPSPTRCRRCRSSCASLCRRRPVASRG
jgi:hypothetical protein